jgi:outer membrane protein assembly factor BamC
MLEHFKRKSSQLLMLLFVLVNVSACSVVDNFMDTKRSKLDYKNNETVKSLDFPPDLTAPEFDMAFVLPANGVVSASAMNNGSQSGGFTLDGRQINVLPKSTNIRAGGIGQSRWLDVSASAESLWPKIRDFWRSTGIPVKRDEPRIGIMETEWVVNRAGLPLNWFNKAMGKVLGSGYDAGSRDRFRIRLEKPTAATTRVFLTHKGAEKVVTGTISGWELRPANHEIEAEMINRLKAFLQGDVVGAARNSTSGSEATQTSSLVNIVTQEGLPVMQIHDNYKRSWVLTGIMLDRMGLVAEKRNQAAGIYNVRYQGDDEDTAKRGFFGRMFGGRKTLLLKGEDYQVHVQDAGKLSIVRITDEEGKPLNKRLSQLVLVRLKQEFDR